MLYWVIETCTRRGSRDLGGRSRYGLRRRGVEEAADGGNSEFAARCELAGSGEVGPERASGKVETDAELAIAELGDWLADDEFATEVTEDQEEEDGEGSREGDEEGWTAGSYISSEMRRT
ncbi:hypothetical protein LQV05_004475 [Cryptococcus neoformans]|nr:hypothetical protein LQV05_004475 [Cryptococcus neoformans]